VRTRCGIFDIHDAVPLLKLEEAFRLGDWQRCLYPIDSVLQDLPALVVADPAIADLKNGKMISIAGSEDLSVAQKYARAYSQDGRFLGILSYLPDSGLWHPEKVFIS
jgi:tRNA U55 pseudouridine synthase TruB